MSQWYCLYCLLNNKEKQIEILTLLNENLFSDALPLDVFLYAKEVIRQGVVPDNHLIVSKFGTSSESLDQCNGIDVTQYKLYIENLREEYAAQEIRQLSYQFANADKISKDDFLTRINTLINNTSYTSGQDLFSITDIVDQIDYNLENQIEPPAISTGIEPLDRFWDPIELGEFVIIAGRPSMGKSAVLGYLAVQNALNTVESLVVTQEMSKEQFVTRMFGSITEIPLWKFKHHKLTEEENKKYKEHVPLFKQMPLVFIDSGGLTIDQIYASIYKAKLKYADLKLVALDYLQLSNVEISNAGIAALSKAIKSMAKEFKVAMIVASQLSRLCEQRENKRPLMSDLRDSGSLEQDADRILGLYNDFRYSGDPQTKDLLEIIILKNRNGEIGKIMVEYEKKTQAFRRIKHGTQLYKTSERFAKL